MPTEQEILQVLQKVIDPELGRNIVELNMIRDVSIQDGKVSFTIALTIPNCPMREKIKADAHSAVSSLKDVKEVNITLGAMTDEERRAVLGTASPQLPKINSANKIKRMIAVMSGKGGVGKSSVSALLAAALSRHSQKVGILDADITGPSIPKFFGMKPGSVRGGEQGMLPPVSKQGIKVMSINLLVQQEDTPVIWRGPMISGAITQFWTDVLWGKLDFLLVDLPPGTSDAALTVMKNLPINEVILVTTPQQLAALVVRKAVYMLKELNIPVTSVVENMSYYPCPDTGKQHEIFGPSHASEVAEVCGAPVSARLPLTPEIASFGDQGLIEDVRVTEIESLAAQLLK
jgi:Mrp family chromosome partitioning ATPase